MAKRAAALAVSIGLLVAACGGGDDADSAASTTSSLVATSPSVETAGTGTLIGPSGGSVTSDDGMFTVEIPAGALASDVEIALSTVPAADAGITGGTELAGEVYDLQPSGLGFSVPVTIIRTVPAGTLAIADDAVPFMHVFHGDGDKWETPDTTTSRDGLGNVIVRSETDHFSKNWAVPSATVFGLTVTLTMSPWYFSAFVPHGHQTIVDTLEIDSERVEELTFGGRDYFYEYTDALVSFGPNLERAHEAVCGSEPGVGSYKLILQAEGEEYNVEKLFFDAVTSFGANALTARRDLFTVATTGRADCVEPPPPNGSDAGAESPSLLGSFGGTITFISLLDDVTYDSPYLLSVLPPDAADAVLMGTAQDVIDRLSEIIRESAVDPEDVSIVLSQGGPDAIAPNTFGVAGDLGGGTIRILTASAEESYSEFYLIDLTFGEGFPVDSQDVVLDVITVGGAPGADIGQAFADMRPFLDGERLGLDDGLWNWGFEGSGTLTREAGNPEG